MVNSAFLVLLTGLTAGLTAAGVAVTASELLSSPQSISVWIGLGAAGLIGTAVILAGKKWAEALVEKLIDLPTKPEIFNAIGNGIEQSGEHHAAVMREVGSITVTMLAIKEEFTKEHQGPES